MEARDLPESIIAPGPIRATEDFKALIKAINDDPKLSETEKAERRRAAFAQQREAQP